MKKFLFPLSFLIVASIIFFVETPENEDQSTADITQPKAALEKTSPNRQDPPTPDKYKEPLGNQELAVTNPLKAKEEKVLTKTKTAHRALEILEGVTIDTMDTKIIPSNLPGGLETRLTLIETNLKYPFMMVEEKGRSFNQATESVESVQAQVATHLILQVRPDVDLFEFENRLASLNLSIKEKLSEGNFIVSLNNPSSLDEVITKQNAIEQLDEFVEVVEPDYFVYAIKNTNDPRLLELWGLHNTGQTGGGSDKDIDGPEAWDLLTGSKDVLVGIIDTGIDRNHEDLSENMWTNPNEIAGNGVDDDQNGYIDDIHGWDFYNNDNNPHDDNSHGTHCAGTIGAVGNNGKGVVGVSWKVSMVGLKFLGGSGGGYLSDGIKSIAYATKIGVDLTSNSWGGGGYSSSMKTAIDEAAAAGIGFVAAAGNHAGDNDAYPSYPASYESENVISVGAHDHSAKSAYFSCYGKTSVDLFAPGVNILSTIPGNGYASYSGTSMATPHVAGAYALILAANPEWQSAQVKDALLENVDSEDSLLEKCLTGGRLNVFQALSNEPPEENLISATPSSLDFGVLGKEESQKLEVVLSNRGNANTTVNDISIFNQNDESLPFELSFPTPFVLEPNTAKAGTVSFSGPAEGLFTANLKVTSDASNESNLSIPLNAQVVTTPNLSVQPNSLHFGLQDQEIQEQIMVLNNSGDGNLIYSMHQRDSSPWLLFDEISEGSLAAGQTMEVLVQVDASQMPSNYEETLIEIVSNDPDQPEFAIKVSAERLSEDGGLVFRPANLEFGSVFVGHSSEKLLEIFNAGTNQITISRMAFADSSFSHHLDFPITLASGEKTSAKIYFTPVNEGAFETNGMVFTDENGFTVRNLPLTGSSAKAPKIVHNPQSISATINMNEQSQFALNLQNTGGSSLNWSLKGANGLMGSSFSLGTVFSSDHFAPLLKGTDDKRNGSPVSTLGGGPDYHGYTWSDSSENAGPDHIWTDISTTGILLEELSSTDDGFTSLTLPFSIDFYENSFDQVFVSSNGYLTLGQGFSDHNHFPLPTNMMAGNLIAAFASDLDPSRGGNIYYLSDENGLTVQYDKVQDFSGQGEYTFQINLNAGGVIRLKYENMDGPIDRATTGIQNASADIGLLVAYNNQQIKSDSTVRISTSPKWLHTSKSQGTIESGQSESVNLTLKAGSIRAGSYEAQLELSSNDPDKKIVTIPVSLTIEEERTISIAPAVIDFGTVEVGLSKGKELEIRNLGNAEIVLESLTIDHQAFQSNFQNLALQPGESEKFKVTFQPGSGDNYIASGILKSNAQNSPNTIELIGKGLATPKLKVVPEVLNVSVEAGNTTVKQVALENYQGLAAGSYSVKEIRSSTQNSAATKFDEQNAESGEIIPDDPFANEHAPNELIVAFKTGKTNFENASGLGERFSIQKTLASARTPGTTAKALSAMNMVLVKAEEGLELADLAEQLSQDPAVEFAEPNYLVRRSALPNDPDLSDQWALEKIQAEQAWDLAKGSESVVVAVIDTGIDYTHSDLEGNIWNNPGEVANNGIDDDGNGYVDDIYGWDFVNSDNDPMDGHNHGTHVAGTIAAATNNNKQVSGVAWHTKLAALKFLADGGWGYTSDAIDAIAYCVAMEIPISNNSWGGGGYSQALKDVITQAGDAGHLFCAAAGNSGSDNDQIPHYPANYDSANIISVAASNPEDKLAYFSCFGKNTVDLAAPGTSILNLIPNGGTAYMSGTSMATPHVAGAAAVLLSQNPSSKHQELKNTLMNSIDPIEDFEGKMVAAGRLNLFNALQATSPHWLTVSPASGVVGAGTKTDLDFSIDASGFVAGTKSAIVTLGTNDPLASNIEIPVNLTVTGSPEILVNPSSLDFGEVWIGKNRTMSIKVKNNGTDSLLVQELTFDHPAFSSNTAEFSLDPGMEEVIEVFGQPRVSENISASLTVKSNDPNYPEVKVILTMQAVTPPAITFLPDSIQLNLEPGDETSKTITLTNSGESQGEWEARVVETNVKRLRDLDFSNLLSGLNAEGRSPDFFNPGHALFLDTKTSANMEDVPDAIRYEGSNNETGLEVGVLGADTATTLEAFGLGLSALEHVSGVTTINVSGLTPTLDEVSAFDAIIVYSNYSYWDNQALGDLISEYAATGGGVITMPGENLFFAESQDWSLTGDWRAQELALFKMQTEYSVTQGMLGEISLPNHPLVEGVNSFSGNVRILHQEPNAGGTIAATWEDGSPLVTFRSEPNLVVDLNFFPAIDTWDQETDGWALIGNALKWTTRSFSPSWITGSPMLGLIDGGTEGTMEVNLDATGLAEGNYSAEVHFSTNDPENSFFAVEVFLEVLENQAPIANAKTFTLKEDGQIQFNLEAYDPDGDELTFVVTQFPTFGSLSGENQNRSYVPAKNFNGTDTLTFKVSDGRKESALTTISFEVEAVNDAPWAQSFEVNATEDQFFFVDFKYGDIDGDNLNLQLSQLPKNGFMWEESGKWLYFPNNHFNGEDSLRYIVSDGELESSEATVQIRLQASNDAPVATHFTLETKEDTSVSFAMLGTDVDQDKLSYQVVKEPLHGRLTENGNNQWTYVPFEQYAGDDSFSYRPFDGTVHGNIGLVSISVTEVNDAPVVQPSSFSLKEDGNIAIKLIASDPEGDQLVFNIVSQPTNGTLVGEGPRYTYTPTTNFNGQDSFQVRASDGSLNSETALISLVVESQNDAPSFEYNLAALSGGVRETPFRIKLITKDADEDTVAISLSSSPENGDCYLEEDELVFLPTPGFTGIENIKLELNDGKVSVEEQLSVTINSHENPYKISFDDQTDPSLINMLYQANEILLQNKKPVFQLEKAVNDQTISANLAVEDDVNAQDLYDWLLNVEDLQGSSFAFHAEEIENRLHWKVSSFLDPVSSVDTDDNTNGNDSGNEVTQGDESDSSQEEELSEDQENTEPNEENGGKNSEEVADEPSVEQLPLIEILGSDWFKAQGIGIFYDAGNGWIYHPEMGWCFLKICTDNNSFWVFHESIGWFWMSQELPNMLYLSSESVNGWFYFPNETLAESTFIYGYENQSWYKWND